MPVSIEIPKNNEPISYLASFAPYFRENERMYASLLGVADSLRQADLIPLEPLGMLACLTAEEEAASFLYYSLLSKEYPVPDYGKIHRHPDKARVLLLADALNRYYFENFPSELRGAIRVERDGSRPKTAFRMPLGDYEIKQDNPLEMIISMGEGEDGQRSALEHAADRVLSDVVPQGSSIKKVIDDISKRRNLCLYGDPDSKFKLRSTADLAHFTSNCVAMVTLGFLVFNLNRPSPSLKGLVESFYKKISSAR